MMHEFNNIALKLQFTLQEENNQINFLDIISKSHNNLNFNIYRKPTTTACIIPFYSCHPLQHKPATIRYMANRLMTHP